MNLHLTARIAFALSCVAALSSGAFGQIVQLEGSTNADYAFRIITNGDGTLSLGNVPGGITTHPFLTVLGESPSDLQTLSISAMVGTFNPLGNYYTLTPNGGPPATLNLTSGTSNVTFSFSTAILELSANGGVGIVASGVDLGVTGIPNIGNYNPATYDLEIALTRLSDGSGNISDYSGATTFTAFAAVPEPITTALGLGAAALFLRRRVKRSAR